MAPALAPALALLAPACPAPAAAAWGPLGAAGPWRARSPRPGCAPPTGLCGLGQRLGRWEAPRVPARGASQASAGDGGRRRPSHRDNDFLYGIYPVLMALRAGKRRCKRLWTQKARGPQTVAPKDEEARAEILERAEALGITLSETSRASLDRMSEDRPHQVAPPAFSTYGMT